MSIPISTPDAARRLGINLKTLYWLIWKGRVVPPAWRFGPALAWTEEDLTRAAESLRTRKRKPGRAPKAKPSAEPLEGVSA
jgi:hypothetical protein